MGKILIVDDNSVMQFTLTNVLKEEGYEIISALDGVKAIQEVRTKSPNLVLLDIKLPGIDGMKILREIKDIDKELTIIMLTAYGEIKDAVEAMKSGAFDYITKPFNNKELILTIKKALQSQSLSKKTGVLRKRLYEKTAIEELMGESQQIKQVLNQVNIISPTNMTVILQGDSGTGKELISQMIHQKSKRSDKPFVAVDCGAIPETLVESELFGYEKGAFTGANERKEGKFEQADGGTLFLDEIGNLSDNIQMKLLRVIQERRIQHLGGKKDIRVDVRIIVASKINLYDAMKAGKFRDDLFHRLNEFRIDLPPLRERKEDIPVLAKYFLNEANQELNKKIKGFRGDVMKFFLNYPWPGNVRELRNMVKKAVLLSDSEEIFLEHLSINQSAGATSMNAFQNTIGLQENSSLKDITHRFEVGVIKYALAKVGGNKIKAAKVLHINRKALYRKMKTLGI